MNRQVLGITNAHQECSKASIIEVEFRRLDQALAEVLMVRLEQEYYITRLKRRQPATNRVMRHAAVCRQTGHIDKLSDTSCTHLNETLEQTQVLYFNDLTHISLDIGHDIVGKPLFWCQITVVDGWIHATPKEIIQT